MYQKRLAADKPNSPLARRRVLTDEAMTTTLAALFMFLAPMFPAQQPSSAANPCTAPQQQQLEFWVGEWNLTWPGQKPGEVGHGTNKITRVMDGCVVQENFSGGEAMHLRGTSVSTFDARSTKAAISISSATSKTAK